MGTEGGPSLATRMEISRKGEKYGSFEKNSKIRVKRDTKIH